MAQDGRRDGKRPQGVWPSGAAGAHRPGDLCRLVRRPLHHAGPAGERCSSPRRFSIDTATRARGGGAMATRALPVLRAVTLAYEDLWRVLRAMPTLIACLLLIVLAAKVLEEVFPSR